ncbi:EAL domain-containing protein [Nitrogeniibacter mangrovi]|uniref:EAL domain-containing protein n=1 Tax=Nitrogeniibacter mangrovi TaxID=2016596 RepID=A0A6C1B294_9RHOO|nr:EAL domain-containing protein [Nitrogeniibacter mangrovi]QID17687.1 EAL domain-containing protein [Nitrogeniibacter mangrovi]
MLDNTGIFLRLCRLVLAVFLVLPGIASAFSQSTGPNDLSDEERAFLARSGPIVFISQTAYPPFEFIDHNSGARKGMMIELATWIGTEYGFHAEFADTTFIDAQHAVLDGRADVLTSFFYSEARDRQFDFTDTVFDIPATIFVAAERPDITDLADLDGKRIAMQRGDYAEEFLKSRGIGVTVVPTASFGAAVDAVLAGRADALIGDEQIVLHYLYSHQLNARMKTVGEPLYVGHNAMAVREGNRVLRSILDKGVARARRTGALDRISWKWSGTHLPGRGIDWAGYWPYAAAAAALVMMALLSNLHLRHVVRAKTRQLLRNQLRLEGIIQGTRAGTWEWHLATGEVVINPVWAEMLGHTPESLGPMSAERINALIHPDDRERCSTLMNEHLAGDLDHYACEVRMRHKDGHWVWLLQRGQTTERDANGRPLVVAGTQIDVTGSKLAQIELQLTASVFANAREGILITDASANIIDVNPAFTRVTGYSRAEAIGQNVRILKSNRHASDFYETLWTQLREHGFWEGEIWNRRKSGEVYPEILTVSGVRDEKGRVSHFVAVFSDISRQKEYERQLEHLAYYDPLTGLPNRVLLVDRLAHAMTRARRRGVQLGLAYLDLDGFKEINDAHGHALGDRVLVIVAGRLKKALRDDDTVARVGGDEFVIVLFDPPATQPQETVIRRLLSAIAEPIHLDQRTFHLSGSIGLVQYGGDSDLDSDQLIRQADQAMYQAKQAGKNRYHLFDAEQDRAVRGRHEVIARVQRAIADNEFVLHYQPKVRMRDGALIGAEALIRWMHPERGLLAPAEFLPHIDTHRTGIELGEWVIQTALNQIAEWRAAGLDLTLSVNIAASHLQQADFVSSLRALLAAHPAVPPHRLELEVLETSALEDVELISEVIGACAELGVRFALDDFGTGYSSLTYLKRLPVDVLKIDQSFVRDMLHDPGDLSILEGVLGLARAFHREVIAEGVETEAHGKLLLQLGCELGQGYGIARPMPAEALERWAGQWRAPAAWTHTGRLPQEDVELLYAASEHRAWLERFAAYALDRGLTPPETDHHRCRFGRWLDKRRGSGRNGTAFETLDTIHRSLHAISSELIRPDSGGDLDGEPAMARLHACSQELLEQLQTLIDARASLGIDTTAQPDQRQSKPEPAR